MYLINIALLIAVLISSNCCFAVVRLWQKNDGAPRFTSNATEREVDMYIAEKSKSIKSLVEEFCLSEFHGGFPSTYRDRLFKYTPAVYKNLLKIIGDGYPYRVYFEHDPIRIVDSYKIKEIKQIDTHHAYAIVFYHQIAIIGESWEEIDAQGDGYKGIPIRRVKDISIKLNLKYDGSRWWIIDPPYPKVSLAVLVKYYSDEISNLNMYLTGVNPVNGKKFTSEDMAKIKSNYDDKKSILNILLSLKNNLRST